MKFFEKLANKMRESNEKTKEKNMARRQAFIEKRMEKENKKINKLIEIENEMLEEYNNSDTIGKVSIVRLSMLKAKLYSENQVLNYVGGSPYIDSRFVGKDTEVCTFNNNFAIKLSGTLVAFENIKNIRLATEQEISNNVTLTRMLAFGIYSLAIKKKKKIITSFLIIEVNENGMDYSLAFGGDNIKINKIYSDLFKKLSAYRTIN